MAVYSDIHTKA